MVLSHSTTNCSLSELKFNSIIIDRVTEFNFLRLITSSNMKWKNHIDHIALEVSKIISMMYRLKFILKADVLLTIYNSLILPLFNYCHLAWDSNITAGHTLHLLQRKAVRIVDHRHFLAHTEPICKKIENSKDSRHVSDLNMEILSVSVSRLCYNSDLKMIIIVYSFVLKYVYILQALCNHKYIRYIHSNDAVINIHQNFAW